MTAHIATPPGTQIADRPEPPPLARVLPGAAGFFYAGVMLDGGILAAAYRGSSPVPDDRLNFPFSGSLATATSLTWGLAQVLFLVTLLAFARSGAAGASRAGRVGSSLTVAGGVLYVLAHATSVSFRDALMTDAAGISVITLFTLASLLTAAGFILAGVAILRAGRWTGWRRWAPLVLGIWMVCMLPLQFTSLLPLSVVVYAVTIAAFAGALACEGEGRSS